MKYGHAANESGYDSPGGIIQPTINSTGDFKTVTKSSIINFPNSSNQAYYSVSNSEFLRSLGLKGQVDRKKYEEHFENKIQSIEKKLLSIETKSSVVNLLQVQLETNAKKMEKIINEQPKNIIHKKQILLFPEYGAREYYKLVLGRLFFWMMMFLLAFYLFSLGKQFIDNWKEVRQEEILINDKPFKKH